MASSLSLTRTSQIKSARADYGSKVIEFRRSAVSLPIPKLGSRNELRSIIAKSSKQEEGVLVGEHLLGKFWSYFRSIDSSVRKPFDVPILTCSETLERLRRYREQHEGKQKYLAMYSSVFGGITIDAAAMTVPIDDHMVHRGHAVFDTTAIVDGYLYEFDQHVNRIIKSASMAKTGLPFDQDTIKSVLIQTVSASKCRNGSLRFWISAGPGDFNLSPVANGQPSLYAVVIRDGSPPGTAGVRVITSSVPIKPPRFARVKSVNYLPNVLAKMEAEESGAYASVWLDEDGFVAEGSNMNVAVVTRESELVIPRFERIQSGCTARRVMILAERLVGAGELRGVSVRDVSVEEAKRAAEMMLLGSGVLVRPVLQWDEQLIGDGKEGRVTEALLDLLIKEMKFGPPSVRVPVPY